MPRYISCPIVLVHVLVHLHFNLVSSVPAQFQLRSSFWNRTGRSNDQSARGDETAPSSSSHSKSRTWLLKCFVLNTRTVI